MLIRDALEQNVDEKIVMSIAWVESRFTAQSKPTKYNCVGPLQIKVRYWCPKKSLDKCDTFYEGVKAVKYYLERFKPMKKAICYYNNSRKCGNHYDTSYTREFFKTLKTIKRIIKNIIE